MPSFVYSARDNAGRTQNGTSSAASAGEVVSSLRERGWIILDIQPARSSGGPATYSSFNPAMWLSPTKFDVEIGLQQIGTMLRSGLTLLAALKTTAEQARRPSMAVIWQKICERIEEGSTFADAVSHHPRQFPGFVVQLIRVGERSGTLETVVTRAAEQLERGRNLRMTLLNALLYPTIVVLMAMGTAGFMLVGVVPKLEKFLIGRGRRLPPITQLLIDISTWIQNWYLHALIGMTVGTVLFILFYRTESGRLAVDGFCLRIPIIGKLLRTAATALLARNLALLIESGVTLLDALSTICNLLSNRFLSRHVGNVREGVMQGGTLAEPLTEQRLFMPMLGRMVAVGEATGTLAPVLNEVADFHEKQLAMSVKRLSVLLEPAIIMVVGGIVGFVYIAFFVAMFSLAG